MSEETMTHEKKIEEFKIMSSDFINGKISPLYFDKWFKQALEETKKGGIRFGDVTAWKKYGIKNKYWEFFAEEVRKEERKRICELLLEKGHGSGNFKRLVISLNK